LVLLSIANFRSIEKQLSASSALIKRLQQLPQTFSDNVVDLLWGAGSSRFPADASSSRMLIKISMQTKDMSSYVQTCMSPATGIFKTQTEATSA
jgi:hypothetical protein